MTTALILTFSSPVALLALFFWYVRNPLFLRQNSSEAYSKADLLELRRHVNFLASITPSRNSKNMTSLNKAADYIKHAFEAASDRIEVQSFVMEGNEYKNIICSFGPEDGQRVIIGAHYDVHFEDNPGADDNASGIAAVLEIARLIAKERPLLKHRLDLIAYTLEECPHFGGRTMGSYVHAESLSKNGEKVKLMISAEMIGYFSDQPNSQNYPFNFLKLFYPSTGDFIGVVGRGLDRKLVGRAKKLMSVSQELPVYSINAPSFVPGIDLSDHRNYWKFDYPALMVTDTAFLRNPNYHMPSDTADSLNYHKMKHVVDGLYRIALDF